MDTNQIVCRQVPSPENSAFAYKPQSSCHMGTKKALFSCTLLCLSPTTIQGIEFTKPSKAKYTCVLHNREETTLVIHFNLEELCKSGSRVLSLNRAKLQDSEAKLHNDKDY